MPLLPACLPAFLPACLVAYLPAESYSPDDNRFDHRQFLYNFRCPAARQANHCSCRDDSTAALATAAAAAAAAALLHGPMPLTACREGYSTDRSIMLQVAVAVQTH